MNHSSQLQRVYVNKYISTKFTKSILSNILYEYDKWCISDTCIINKDIDVIIFMMSKEHFLSVIRTTIIMLKRRNILTNFETSLLNPKDNKRTILTNMMNNIVDFKIYFVIVLYYHI